MKSAHITPFVKGALLTLPLSFTFMLWACSDASFYHTQEAPFFADRVTLRGEACTEDTRASGFPVKLLLMVDQAPGELYSSFDPGLARLRALNELTQLALSRPEYEVALIGYGGRASRLAPREGAFTRDPSELLSAVNQLALPARCFGEDTCRDPLSAFELASGVIQDDLATMDLGLRALTHYQLVWVVAAPASPLARRSDCCASGDRACLRAPLASEPSPSCQLERELEALDELAQGALTQGAGEVSLSVLHLRASTEEALNEQAREALERLSLAGRGRYSSASAAEQLDPRALGLFEPNDAWETSQVLVSNLSAAPRAGGLEPDSDQDGLSDEEERRLGSDPLSADSDGDGLQDGVESKLGLSLELADVPSVCASLSEQVWRLDRDRDGLNECEERLIGTDPSLTDSDGDDLPDGLELSRGTDLLIPDSAQDFDEDGVPNGDEVREGSDPQSVDDAQRLGLAARYEVERLGAQSRLSLSPLTQLEGARLTAQSPSLTPGPLTLQWVPKESARFEELKALADEGGAALLPEGSRAEGELVGVFAFKASGEGELGPWTPVWRGEEGARSSSQRLKLYARSALEQHPELAALVWGLEPQGADDESLLTRPSTAEQAALLDNSLSWLELEVTSALLPTLPLSEQLVGRLITERCLSYTVRNVRLVAVQPTAEERAEGERAGLNELRVYVSQKRLGRSELPGRLLMARVPVRYAPPNSRSPSSASITVERGELSGPQLNSLALSPSLGAPLEADTANTNEGAEP